VNNFLSVNQFHALRHASYSNVTNFGGNCVQSLYEDTYGGRIEPKHVVMCVTGEQKAYSGVLYTCMYMSPRHDITVLLAASANGP
jgi:hypothetical protein